MMAAVAYVLAITLILTRLRRIEVVIIQDQVRLVDVPTASLIGVDGNA
jgi:hypothetical protein